MRFVRLGAGATAFLVATALPARAQQAIRSEPLTLQRILVAEDNRGTGADGLAPLLTGMRSSDTLFRRVSVRALGRIQRQELGRQLVPLLTDPVPAIRAEAANAIAQSMARASRRPNDSLQVHVTWAGSVLGAALGAERDSATRDAIAEALGRLSFADTAAARAAELAIVAHGGTGYGAIHGLYWLTLSLGTRVGLSSGVPVLRVAAASSSDPKIRRVAMLGLIAVPMNMGVAASIVAAGNDPDELVRRTVVVRGALTRLPDSTAAQIVVKALADPSPLVRMSALPFSHNCAALVAATRDANAHVVQIAIPVVAKNCADTALAVKTLTAMIEQAPNLDAWRAPAAALLALADIDKARTREMLRGRGFGESKRPEVRAIVAQAAAIVRDTATVHRLALDADNNVRAAAITAIHDIGPSFDGSVARAVYTDGLKSKGYQVVLEVANSLQGMAKSESAPLLPALLDAFDRLSAERRENAKDPRVAVLKRISEIGSASDAERLRPHLADFDTIIARSVAATISKWSSTQVDARPAPLKIPVEPLADIFLAKSIQLKVTMAASSGGGTYTIKLFNNEAPVTVARIVKLARAHFYDGHVFQRVEPIFVTQGGGPDASEFVGDAQFMRDEVTPHSHFRGTLGISSRGRDTGDAQWFFNLIDNTRLDHEYTVFGEVVSGWSVVERIVDGDAIGRVEVVQ